MTDEELIEALARALLPYSIGEYNALGAARAILPIITAARRADQERIVAFIQKHYESRCPFHSPNEQTADLVQYGYGNACSNLLIAIEAGDHNKG